MVSDNITIGGGKSQDSYGIDSTARIPGLVLGIVDIYYAVQTPNTALRYHINY